MRVEPRLVDMKGVGRARIALLAALALAALSLPATSAGKWTVPGRGFGHGVGMSQYGTYGYAKQGRPYKKILRHYFEGTQVADTEPREIRVLITTGLGSLPFTGARKACGRQLKESRSYSFALSGSGVSLRRANGAMIAACGDEGSARGGRSVTFSGVGAYRGALIGRAVAGSVYAINRVGLDGYVKGVMPNEVIASWPRAALRAQAVAARSYALATRIGGDGYDLYDDTRSQVYGGYSSEEPQTNAATDDTAREVVKHNGHIATTYFFSASGGRTENAEFGFPGGIPRPYLKSQSDPYDDTSSLHRWKLHFTNAEMASKLGDLFAGKLQQIRILKTGISPRIVRARVIGSQDSTTVSGAALQYRLGLRSTWAKFRKGSAQAGGGGGGGGGVPGG